MYYIAENLPNLASTVLCFTVLFNLMELTYYL